ncbi:MAG: MarR family transcriptional regulator [Pseudomonadota bacterium]
MGDLADPEIPHAADYVLDDQVGFVLRLVRQRHVAIFQKLAPFDLTPTQFSALVRLAEMGECSQNELGRRTAMDVATIKGVVDRLRKKGLVQIQADPQDKRRTMLSVHSNYRAIADKLHDAGHRITAQTMEPLTSREQAEFLRLLKKLS